MYGVVTRTDSVLDWPEFDRGFYEVKSVSGRERAPVANAVNMIACFADNATASDRPDLVPVSDEADPATADRPYFDWSYICPTHRSYRSGLLEIIAGAGSEGSGAVRLDEIGFPRAEYCHCDACVDRYAASSEADRRAWRVGVITEFVEAAAERVPGDLYLTVYPDPYPGHLTRRTGVDLSILQRHADEIVVPLYDQTYSTTYWIESIVTAFRDRVDCRLGVEIYAAEAEFDRMLQAARVADATADAVYFGYDAGQARAAIRRIRAAARPGRRHGAADVAGDES